LWQAHASYCVIARAGGVITGKIMRRQLRTLESATAAAVTV